jgi:cGMP-dependent protein kinase
LKPENVVVDEEGYLKLIDFGTAKIVNGRTYTIVGTPHYMAPEVILRKGYTVAVDYWSLGIVLYELLFEKVPFAEEEEDPMIVYEIVLTARLRYPRIQKPMSEVKSVIDQLLNKNPSLRMGAGFEKLKSHPWFSFIDWEKLLSKDIKAPYKPKVKKLDPDLILEHMRDQSLNSFLAKEETDNLPESSSKSSSKWDVDF